jgi:hypothetical protein
MLRSGLHIFVLALTAVAQPVTASAQKEEPCGEVQCRAIRPFRTCDKPLEGATILSARVLAKSRECRNDTLSNVVSVQVEDAHANNLPDVIEISLGSCTILDRNVGDTIKVAESERHSPDVRRYQLACR